MTSANLSETATLACELVRRPSVTPDDAGCQSVIGERLAQAGFRIEPMPFGDVANLWACHGDGAPLVVFAGHTDVVPTGEVSAWRYPPFAARLDDGVLYGRGAADMKGSVAAMITAVERYVTTHPDHPGTVACLLTSDEEGPAIDGTARVVDTLRDRGIEIDYCIVGEPSCSIAFGDTLRCGRRGSLTAVLEVQGVQGHVAYPLLADNPIHRVLPFLDALATHQWDAGTDTFPPTSFQISNIAAGTGADNVVPGRCRVTFNFRYSPALTPEALQSHVEDLLREHELNATLDWRLSAEPFSTPMSRLTDVYTRVVQAHTGCVPRPDTGGGTSDGRFLATISREIVEFGGMNTTIHQTDERVDVAELDSLSSIHEAALERLLMDHEDT